MVDYRRITKELLRAPRKDKGTNMPRFLNTKKDGVHQADVLFLPDDEGYKYLLVVVDVASRLTDTEPMKNKDAKTTRDAIKKIYARNTLNYPKMLQVDAGGEFEDVFETFIKNKGVVVRTALPGRHRQQALVEGMNSAIGKKLMEILTARELETGEQYDEWKQYIPDIVKEMNQKRKPIQTEQKKTPADCKNRACELLPVGQLVRVIADTPRNVFGKTEGTKFRHGILRWDKEPRKIKRIILRRAQPPMYLVEGKPSTVYTRNQLQEAREEDIVKATPSHGEYDVERFEDRRKRSGRIEYLVKWEGWEQRTWEPAKNLREDLGELKFRELKAGMEERPD